MAELREEWPTKVCRKANPNDGPRLQEKTTLDGTTGTEAIVGTDSPKLNKNVGCSESQILLQPPNGKMLGSEFGVHSMKAWIHAALYQ